MKLNSAEDLSLKSGTIAFYWRIVLKPHLWESSMTFLLILATTILDVLAVGLSVPLLDAIMKPENAAETSLAKWMLRVLGRPEMSQDVPSIIFFMLLAITLLFISRSGLTVFCRYYIAAVAFKLRNDIKASLLERMLYSRFEDLTKKGRGVILKDITGPAEAIYISIANIGYFMMGIFTVVLLTGMLIYLSWPMTVLMGVTATLTIEGWRWLASKRSAECGRQVYEFERSESKIALDAVDGIKVVKSHMIQPGIMQRYREVLSRVLKPQLSLTIYGNAPLFINEFAGGMAIIILGFIACYYPHSGVTFSLLGAFLVAVRRISPSIAAVNNAMVDIRRSLRGLEVVDEILNRSPLESGGVEQPELVKNVSFDQVSFSYSYEGVEILKAVSFDASQGTVTAIVGPTGAGKSTIANLVMRLYEPRSGKILVNNAPIQNLDLSQWRKKIGYVSQDVFLFNATLRENLTLWDPGVTLTQLNQAVELAQMDEFVVQLPQGLETAIGDRGLRLSGGQCQRLAIARAILRQPEILIFDEATSALDNLTERAIYQAIEKLRNKSIVVMISHRLSTINRADQIIVLESGCVVERGSPADLLKAQGLFWRLHQAEVAA